MIFKSKLVFRRFSKSNKHNNQVVILCRFCLQHLCEVLQLGKGKTNKFLGELYLREREEVKQIMKRFQLKLLSKLYSREPSKDFTQRGNFASTKYHCLMFCAKKMTEFRFEY